jgi:hypothetical protein
MKFSGKYWNPAFNVSFSKKKSELARLACSLFTNPSLSGIQDLANRHEWAAHDVLETAVYEELSCVSIEYWAKVCGALSMILHAIKRVMAPAQRALGVTNPYRNKQNADQKIM